MKDDYSTNSHYLTYTFSLWEVGRMYISNLGVKGLKKSRELRVCMMLLWRGNITKLSSLMICCRTWRIHASRAGVRFLATGVGPRIQYVGNLYHPVWTIPMTPSAFQSQLSERNLPETPPPETRGSNGCEVHCRWCPGLWHKRGSDHDSNLEGFMPRCQQKGIKFNAQSWNSSATKSHFMDISWPPRDSSLIQKRSEQSLKWHVRRTETMFYVWTGWSITSARLLCHLVSDVTKPLR